LTIIVGVIALVWPGPTLLVVGVLLGAYLLIWGVLTPVRGIGGADGMHPGLRLTLVLLGLFGCWRPCSCWCGLPSRCWPSPG
jgi:uncharacterized membrane protein HdeD (DUF308 family)